MPVTSVIEWLLDSDPSIRWQVMPRPADRVLEEVAAERARVEHEGWGARLLAPEVPDGLMERRCLLPRLVHRRRPGQQWTATLNTLQTLRLLGLDPAAEAVRRAVALVAPNGRWEHAGQPYFDGEVEPCINGRTLVAGAYFGDDVAPIVERLLAEQLDDGGWNCEAENGWVRSSFDSTIDVLEGLLEFERAIGGWGGGAAARRRGEEYLLERSLFRQMSTVVAVNPAYWSSCSRTNGTTTCCARWTTSARAGDPTPAGGGAGRRANEATARWPMAARAHPSGPRPLRPRGRRGRPSRWNTLARAPRAEWSGSSARG